MKPLNGFSPALAQLDLMTMTQGYEPCMLARYGRAIA